MDVAMSPSFSLSSFHQIPTIINCCSRSLSFWQSVFICQTMMTTSSGLSADAKEFIPHSTNPQLTYLYVAPPPPPPPSIVYVPTSVGFYPPPLIYPVQRVSRQRKPAAQPPVHPDDASYRYRAEDFPTLAVPNAAPTIQP